MHAGSRLEWIPVSVKLLLGLCHKTYYDIHDIHMIYVWLEHAITIIIIQIHGVASLVGHNELMILNEFLMFLNVMVTSWKFLQLQLKLDLSRFLANNIQSCWYLLSVYQCAAHCQHSMHCLRLYSGFYAPSSSLFLYLAKLISWPIYIETERSSAILLYEIYMYSIIECVDRMAVYFSHSCFCFPCFCQLHFPCPSQNSWVSQHIFCVKTFPIWVDIIIEK